MKYQASFQASPKASAAGFAHQATELVNRVFDIPYVWLERRRERYHLATLDDHLLRDIGLDRAEAERISAKPFWRD